MGQKTLVYAPEVKVVIQPRQHKGEELDISSDIIDGFVTRDIDAVSHGSITLNNRRGRYTNGLIRLSGWIESLFSLRRMGRGISS